MVTWRCRIDEQSYQVARCIAKHWGIPLSKAIGRMLHEYAADLSAQLVDEGLKTIAVITITPIDPASAGDICFKLKGESYASRTNQQRAVRSMGQSL